MSYANVFAQVMLRLPAVGLWLDHHASMCAGGVGCMACALRNSRGQLGQVTPAEFVRRARLAGVAYRDLAEEHDAVRFAVDALQTMRDAEVVAGWCGEWAGVGTQGASVATHVDRIFGVLVEERRE